MIRFLRWYPWLEVIFLRCRISRWYSDFSVALILKIMFFSLLFSSSRYSIPCKVAVGVIAGKKLCCQLFLKFTFDRVDFRLYRVALFCSMIFEML